MLACGLTARAGSPPGGYSYPLFDGQSLHGWNIENDARANVIESGTLLLQSNSGWLRTSQKYDDFVLHVEWQPPERDDYHAGIFFRAGRSDQPHPHGAYQLDLSPGNLGTVVGLEGALVATRIAAARPWQALDLRVVGTVLTLAIDGRHLYQVGGVARGAGSIGLNFQSPSEQTIAFRNLHITELRHESLFNGRDFSGWEGAGAPESACWEIRDGALVCFARGGPWLRSKRRFGDFNLRLEYIVAPGANSGVYVRVPSDGNHHRDHVLLPSAGFEVQILDDSASQYADLKDYQYSGSVYDIAGARHRVSRRPGEWNTLEINCYGQHVTTTHNGVEIVDATSDEFPLLALRRMEGHLGLQNHGEGVQFRRIRIGPPLER
jgi:hypothetical protein